MMPPSPFDELTDEERQRLLEAYAPGAVSTGPVTRGAQGFAPVVPRASVNALGGDRAPLAMSPAASAGMLAPKAEDPSADFIRRFIEAQERGAGNASFNRLGSRLDGFARVYAGLNGPGVVREDESLRNRPVQDLMAQRGVEQQGRATARQQELDAVNLAKTKAETRRAEASAASTEEEAAREAALARVDSPETEAQRKSTAALLAKNPKVTPELLAGMNGLQLREMAKTGTSQINAEVMAGLRQLSIEQQAKNAEEDRELRAFIAQQGWNLAQLTLAQQLEIEKWRAERDAQKSAREAGIASDNKVAADTKDISEAFDKAGGPNFYAKYEEVSDLLKKHPKDIPGFGKVDGQIPDMFVSGDALTARQAIGQMLAEYRKGITGAGMSNSEREEYGRITGLLQSNNERSVRQGVEMLRSGMDARFKAMAGGYRPEAVQTYAQRVPTFGRALQGSPVAPVPKVGTRENPAPSNATFEPIPVEDLPTGKPAPKPAADSIRVLNVAGWKPGDLKKNLKEGEVVRLKHNGQVIQKKNGKIVPYKVAPNGP